MVSKSNAVWRAPRDDLWTLAVSAVGPNFYHEGKWYSHRRFAIVPNHLGDPEVGHIKGPHHPTWDPGPADLYAKAMAIYDVYATMYPEAAADQAPPPDEGQFAIPWIASAEGDSKIDPEKGPPRTPSEEAGSSG